MITKISDSNNKPQEVWGFLDSIFKVAIPIFSF